MYVERFLEKELEKYMKSREILAVLGPRQCGKTTLMRHIFQQLERAAFVDFEDREAAELFSGDIKAFAELYVKPYKYLFIDEFQYAAEGGKNLKYLYDTHSTKIVVSGSSASGMVINGIRFLTGRVFTFNLYPFSFAEWLSYKEPRLYALYSRQKLTAPLIARIVPYFHEFCVYGGYPRVALAADREEKETVLKNIYNTYVLKEIKEILNLPGDYRLSRLISALGLQVSGMMHYKELADISGFSYGDLLNYMNVLEKTFVTIRSLPFYTNKRTELVKTQKIFFLDNGFRNAVTKNYQQAGKRPDTGALYENFVASELAKKGYAVKYWRTKAKAEVDFVVEREGKPMPIEVKGDLKQAKMTKSYRSFLEKYKPEQGLMLSTRLATRSDNVRFAPVFAVGRHV